MDWFSRLTVIPIETLVTALVGVLIGSLLTHSLTRRREHKKLRREKAEDLLHTLYAYKEWINLKHNALLYRQPDPETPNPLNLAYTIQRSHFAELQTPLDGITKTFIPLNHFFFAQRRGLARALQPFRRHQKL